MHELIERFEAHLTARQYFSVIANMKGTSPEEVASRLLNVPGLEGLQVREKLSRSCMPSLNTCLNLQFFNTSLSTRVEVGSQNECPGKDL